MIQNQIEFAKLVGKSSASHWSQVHAFTPPDKDRRTKRGQLFILVSLTHPPQGSYALELGREILTRLNEEYYGKLTLSPAKQLAAALTSVIQEFASEARTINLAAAVLYSSHSHPHPAIYLALHGEAQIWLKRADKFGRLLSGKSSSFASPQPQAKAGLASLSGWAHPNDWFVLGTPQLFSHLSRPTWQQAFSTDTPQDAATLLAPLVHGQENGQALTGLFLRLPPSLSSHPLPPLTPSRPPSPPAKLLGPSKLLPQFRLTSARLSGLTQGLSSLLPSLLFKRQLYLHTRSALKSKTTALTVAILLLLLLAASLYFGNKKYQAEIRRSAYLPQLERAENQLSQGQALSVSSPDESHRLISEAGQTIADLKSRGITDPRLTQLENSLGQVLGFTFGQYQVTGQLYHDLSLTRQDLTVDSHNQEADTAWLLQRHPVRLLQFNFSTKKTTIIAGEDELGQARQVAGTTTTAFVISDKGILAAGKSPRLLLAADEINLSSNLLVANYGANLYVLDKDQNEIWRFPTTSEGSLAPGQRWLAPGITPQLQNAQSLAIDGSIWILSDTGRVEEYLRGAPQSFALAHLDKPLAHPQDIYTDTDSDSLYLLDSGNSRLLVADKDGNYQAQYLWDSLKDATAIFVQEAKHQAFVLINTQIYLIPLQ